MGARAGQAELALWWDEGQRLIRLSLPIVLTNLGQISIQTTEVVLLGWLSPEALAASVLGINVIFPLTLFGIGVVLATAPMMAHDLGRKSYAVREPRRTTLQGFWVAVLITLPAWLLLWQIGPILTALRQEPALIELAKDYVHAAMWGLLPTLWFTVQRNFVAAVERPRPGMVVMFLGVGFNVVVSYGLIFGAFGLPALGVLGAGIAASLTNWLLFFMLQLYLMTERRFRRYRLLGEVWRIEWPRVREIIRLGLPIGVTLIMEVGLFAASGFMMGWLGTAALAAHQIALQCAGVTFMVPLGLCQGATVRVGLAAGRGDRSGARRAGVAALGLGVLFMGSTATCMLLWPGQIVGLFLDRQNPANSEAIGLAMSFLLVAAWFQIFDGSQVIGGGALRGLKDTRWPMLLAIMAYWLFGITAALGLGFGLGLGGLGIWLGLATALAVAAVSMVARFLLLVRRQAWQVRA